MQNGVDISRKVVLGLSGFSFITEPSVLVAEMSTGLAEEVFTNEQLTVFPIPVSDVLSFRLLNEAAGPLNVELLASDGRLLRTIRTQARTMDVSGLAAGLYALRVNGISARFIKH
ncbi:MAG: T9SS type A sorting domain-containing protein [Flavobacteriales bacterium]|nr:T9SS type A sorting domain-containing protein [Flavobacteriales bacterium]